ncbi:hypothetical protein D3C86_1384370 [compost metagenome]
MQLLCQFILERRINGKRNSTFFIVLAFIVYLRFIIGSIVIEVITDVEIIVEFVLIVFVIFFGIVIVFVLHFLSTFIQCRIFLQFLFDSLIQFHRRNLQQFH